MSEPVKTVIGIYLSTDTTKLIIDIGDYTSNDDVINFIYKELDKPQVLDLIEGLQSLTQQMKG